VAAVASEKRRVRCMLECGEVESKMFWSIRSEVAVLVLTLALNEEELMG
jgi:hypothetical protein